jgi:hypothetical protein
MAMTRIWNVTNNPATPVVPQNLLVLGKLLYPGKSMQVDEEILKTAHKIRRDEIGKLLYVGKRPPSYLQEKPKIVVKAEHHRTSPKPEPSPEEPPKEEVKPTEEASVETEEKETPQVEVPESSESEVSSESTGHKERGKKGHKRW